MTADHPTRSPDSPDPLWDDIYGEDGTARLLPGPPEVMSEADRRIASELPRSPDSPDPTPEQQRVMDMMQALEPGRQFPFAPAQEWCLSVLSRIPSRSPDSPDPSRDTNGGRYRGIRWWGVQHECDGEDRVYPTLHWADEPEKGAGPREAFECDVCGDRYTFIEVRRSSDSVRTLDVERLGLAIAKHWHDHPTSGYSFGHCASEVAAEYARLAALHPASPPQEGT
jgi:hypothetical protein